MNTSVFGLLAWLEQTRIHLPLVHIETRFRVTGEIVLVEMDQVFEQTAGEALDVTYTFPLPGHAAVHRCEMIVNGRTIRAVVMEEKEARRVVAEKKAAGHRTALVEMDRDNLFTLQLGNVAPGDRIVIRFAYFQWLDRLGPQLSLRVPFSPGVRYIPGKPLLRANRGHGSVDDTDQVPDASRISPPRISGDHPDAATLYLHGLLDESEISLASLISPSHPVHPRVTAGRIEVELDSEAIVPALDFVLRWEEKASTAPAAHSWANTYEGDTYALLQLRAPRVEQTAVADDLAQDMYFLLDRSGSMEGMKWLKCAEALHAFVKELGAQDRIWITCFESSFQDFAEAPLLRDEMLNDPGFLSLADLGTGGGTELLPALENVLAARRGFASGRPSRLILITDGQVGNEAGIFERMGEPDARHLPVHCFGIDDTVNDAFLQKLARQTGGRCVLMTPQDDIPAAIHRLAVTLRRPVLTGLVLERGGLPTVDDNPQLADLHAGEVTLLPLRFPEGTAEAVITGRLPDGSAWRQAFAIEPDNANAAPSLVWAQRRCRHLVETGRQVEAVALAVSHNVVCKGTSFAAWDEAEKAAVAKVEVYQPSFGSWDAAAGGAVRGGSAFMKRRGGGEGHCCMSFGPPPPIPAQETCYFEGKVGNGSLSRKRLKECSDEDLVAVPPPPVNRQRQLRDIAARYIIKLMDNEPAKWVKPLQDCLVKSGMDLKTAATVVDVLRAWASQLLGWGRDVKLLDLVAALNASACPLEMLVQFIDQHLRGQKLEDVKTLLGPTNAGGGW